MIAQAPRRRTLSRPIPYFAAALLAASLALGQGGALAQDDTPPQEPRAAPADQPKAPPGEAGDSVGNRLGRVEEQLNDLRAMIGALESLVKAKPEAVLPQESAHGQGAGAQGDLGARVEALETQLSALTSQLEQVTQQLSAFEAKHPGSPQSSPPPAGGAAPGRQGAASPQAPDAVLAGASGDATVPPVAEGEPSPLPPFDGDARPGAPAAEDQPQSLAAATPGSNATSLYNQGYGELLRRDYAAAETEFAQLVHTYPDDPLAGKAQYWLGETHYVRGQYKEAADAFLKGYKQYKSGEKAPDSLLKLAMALAQLGQKQAACSAFSELAAKFPKADERLRDEANGEWHKAGC